MSNYPNILKGKTVLVVDDNSLNIYALGHYLENIEMNVVVAGNGHEAIKILGDNSDIDIVLMDMMMPELDGYATIETLKNLDPDHTVPIIAVTANAMKGDREKCMAAGASDYVSKPINLADLASKMAKLVQHSTL